MNSHLYDNVRPLICPQVARTSRHRGVAQVIRLPVAYRRRRPNTRYLMVLSFVAVTALILLFTLFAVTPRFGRIGAGDFIPGWPWW